MNNLMPSSDHDDTRGLQNKNGSDNGQRVDTPDPHLNPHITSNLIALLHHHQVGLALKPLNITLCVHMHKTSQGRRPRRLVMLCEQIGTISIGANVPVANCLLW